jgi:hypothetical protein
MKPALSWKLACELMLFAETGQFSETRSNETKDQLLEQGLIVDGQLTESGRSVLARLVSGELARLLEPVCSCGHAQHEHAAISGKCIIAGCACASFAVERRDA